MLIASFGTLHLRQWKPTAKSWIKILPRIILLPLQNPIGNTSDSETLPQKGLRNPFPQNLRHRLSTNPYQLPTPKRL